MDTLLSCLDDARRRIILSRLALLVWPKMKHSLKCLWLLSSLVLNSLHNVLEKYIIYAKCEMDIHIHWKIIIVWKLPKTQTRQDQTKPGKTSEKRRRPDKEGSCGFENTVVNKTVKTIDIKETGIFFYFTQYGRNDGGAGGFWPSSLWYSIME